MRRLGEGLFRPEPGPRTPSRWRGALGLQADVGPGSEALAAALGAERELARRQRRGGAHGLPAATPAATPASGWGTFRCRLRRFERRGRYRVESSGSKPLGATDSKVHAGHGQPGSAECMMRSCCPCFRRRKVRCVGLVSACRAASDPCPVCGRGPHGPGDSSSGRCSSQNHAGQLRRWRHRHSERARGCDTCRALVVGSCSVVRLCGTPCFTNQRPHPWRVLTSSAVVHRLRVCLPQGSSCSGGNTGMTAVARILRCKHSRPTRWAIADSR